MTVSKSVIVDSMVTTVSAGIVARGLTKIEVVSVARMALLLGARPFNQLVVPELMP